jgi:S-formylglutathione hydrolase FrmB
MLGGVVVGLALLGATVLGAPTPAQARPAATHALAPLALHDAAGLHVTSVTRTDDRLFDVTVTTAALSAPTSVRVLLPVGYDAAPTKRYPVLYLLHGRGGTQLDWTLAGDATAITAPYQVITVMPSGGRGGFYANWLNFGKGGPPKWETYHIDQLIPFIDANLRTIPKRQGRAIAGLSMGGFGAMSYAARHPDLFVSASSFSGALDVSHPAAQVVVDVSTAEDGGVQGQAFGIFADDPIPWYGHDPLKLAENLRSLRVASYVNQGALGGDLGNIIEYWAHENWVAFNARLTQLGIPKVAVDYGPGTHAWPNWQRALRDEMPQIMAVFANPPADPSAFWYRTTDPYASDYGWTVGIIRTRPELAELIVLPGGFALTGSGVAEVVTRGGHPRDAVCQASVRTDGGAPTTQRPVIDVNGRLHIAVPLGPSTPGDILGRHIAQVTITGVGCR